MPRHATAAPASSSSLEKLYAKIEDLKKQAMEELRQARRAAQAEVERLDAEIERLTSGGGIEAARAEAKVAAAARAVERAGGHHPQPKAARGKRLKQIEQGSEEWEKVAGQIKLVMKHHPDGANGKVIAKGLGLLEPNEAKRVLPVIQGTLKRQGEGVATRYFLR